VRHRETTSASFHPLNQSVGERFEECEEEGEEEAPAVQPRKPR
jgi:hypothetical protein